MAQKGGGVGDEITMHHGSWPGVNSLSRTDLSLLLVRIQACRSRSHVHRQPLEMFSQHLFGDYQMDVQQTTGKILLELPSSQLRYAIVQFNVVASFYLLVYSGESREGSSTILAATGNRTNDCAGRDYEFVFKYCVAVLRAQRRRQQQQQQQKLLDATLRGFLGTDPISGNQAIVAGLGRIQDRALAHV